MTKEEEDGFLNTNHPEKRDDEIFLCNCCINEDFDEIGWETKRPGEQAYTRYGYRIAAIKRTHPVFVQKAEIEKQRKLDEEEK